jgi:hypothetical protein
MFPIGFSLVPKLYLGTTYCSKLCFETLFGRDLMTRQNYKVYKALAEDITMPYTWVSTPLRPRQIAKITNHNTGQYIFCKILEIDKSFRNRYNSKDRCPLSSTDHVIVLNGWCRNLLGIEKRGNKFKTNLEIKQAYERWPFYSVRKL